MPKLLDSCFIIEGIRSIEEAINDNVQIVNIYYTEDFLRTTTGKSLLDKIQHKKIKALQISNRRFRHFADTQTPQGIIAMAKKISFTEPEFFNDVKGIMVFCYKISDPGNLGTIIRICDAVGVNRIVLSKDTVNQYNPKVVRATMGSVFNVPILSGSEIIDSIARMREKKIKIIMADTTAKKNYDVVSYSTPCALFVGSEASGLPNDILKYADEIVKIPIFGKAESLNVAVATGIILYEMAKQIRNCKTNA